MIGYICSNYSRTHSSDDGTNSLTACHLFPPKPICLRIELENVLILRSRMRNEIHVQHDLKKFDIFVNQNE